MTVTAEIQITDRAQSHIMEQLKKSGSSSLRLGVKESGCNGFMYTLESRVSDHASGVDCGLCLSVLDFMGGGFVIGANSSGVGGR